MMNRFFRMIAENEEETQYKKPAMEVSKKYLVNMQILLCFMFCHGSDIDMTSHVPIVLSLGIMAHNLLRILSGPGSS